MSSYSRAGALRAAEGVEQVKLPFRAEERLVIVGTVQVHEQVAQLLEDGQGRRRTVDELPVAPGLREGALDDQPAVDAAFEAVFVELGVECAAVVHVEGRLHRAGVRAGADEAFVRALAEQQLERAEDDGLARAGLPGDHDEPGRELPVEFFDERQILDAQRGERCQHGSGV